MSKPAWDSLIWILVSAFLWIAGGVLDIVDPVAPYVALAVAFSVFFAGVDYIVKAIEKQKK